MRSQKRDADSEMIINNALRNKKKSDEYLAAVKKADKTELCVQYRRTSQDYLFRGCLRQQDLLNSEQIWLFLPTGRNQIKGCNWSPFQVEEMGMGWRVQGRQCSSQLHSSSTHKTKALFSPSRLIIILYFQDVKKRINRFRLANCEKSEDV